jgi:hypothetical protein
MAGDIRGEGAAILQQLWDALGWPEDVSEAAGVVTRFGVRFSLAIGLCVIAYLLSRDTRRH